MTQVSSQRFVRTLGMLQIAIIILVVITALVHLQRGIGMSLGGFGGPPPGGFQGGPRGGSPGGFPGGAPGGFNMLQLLPLPLPILFLINGIGYLVLVTALYLPALARYRGVVRWLLIVFATATFVLYFLFNGFRLNPIAVVDKAVELTLIVLLLVDARQDAWARVEIAQ